MDGDGVTVHRMVEWSYSNVHAAGGKAWKAPTRYEVVDDGYLTVVRVSAQSDLRVQRARHQALRGEFAGAK